MFDSLGPMGVTVIKPLFGVTYDTSNCQKDPNNLARVNINKALDLPCYQCVTGWTQSSCSNLYANSDADMVGSYPGELNVTVRT